MSKLRQPGYLVSQSVHPQRATGVLLDDASPLNAINWISSPDFSRLPDQVAKDLSAKTYGISMTCEITTLVQSKSADIQVGQRARSSEGLAGSGDFPDTAGVIEYDDLGVLSFDDYYTGNFYLKSFEDFIQGWFEAIRARFSFLESVEITTGEDQVSSSTMETRGPLLFYREGENGLEFGAGFEMTGEVQSETFIGGISQGIDESATATAYVSVGSAYIADGFGFIPSIVDRWELDS